MLTVDEPMTLSPTITRFNATNGTVNKDSLGENHFTATSGDGTFTMLIIGDLTAGSMNDLANEHNFLSIDITGAGWSSNGGTIAIDGVNPTRVRFLAVPMLHGSGSAKGGFVLNGSGTFK
ncbi:MAG: hypothetical protein JWN44_5085 [Myxococcales bacterium]|nr:hypothetical protein [Myxococcales bacterium]